MDKDLLIVTHRRDLNQPNEDQALNDHGSTPGKFLLQMEITHLLTTLYVLVEVGRWEDSQGNEPIIRQAFGMVSSMVLVQLLTVTVCS